ncbi:hypothetical protein ACFYO2_35145 [Streptomyces sp. NPDC006602]|uniref:hypothetical protein n=1 Tax=Streptomyces sp. NPDC006602 TaxID=3364751 RepID=UPI0036C1C4C3
MPLLDLDKITVGLSKTWSGFLRDWDRSLRAGNCPEATRYNYLLAAAQLGRYLSEYSPDPEADDAAEDLTEVTRAHVEAFQAWMIETRSASTASLVGADGRAAFDAVGPLLLIGWAEVGPGLLQAINGIRAVASVARQRCATARVPPEGDCVACQQPNPVSGTAAMTVTGPR